MVHYKIQLDVLRDLGMGEGAWQTFCGEDTREMRDDDDVRHVPTCDSDECKKLVVNCPVCKGVYEVISKDYVENFVSKDASQ
jgi:hypothetical protein